MSTNMTPEDAYNILVSQVHAPVFFTKLANVYNIKPETEEDASELLLIAAQLRNAHEQDQAKQASARTNYFADARKELTDKLNITGYNAIPYDDISVKQAAKQAIQHEQIKEAAYVFSEFLSSQVNN